MRRYATWCLGVAAAAALATSAYALDFTGLVAAYTFDEGTGDTAADSSGNGYDGVIMAGDWVDGVFGMAAEFTGGNSHMAAEGVFASNPNNAITLGAWFQLIAHTTYEGVISGSDPAVGGCCHYRIMINPGSSPFYNAGAHADIAVAGTTVEGDRWYHYVMTIDGEVKIYLDGEVVGINSQIYTRSGGFMGLSFAVPISVAMNVADQLRTEGHVSRGWLGVVIQPVSKDLAESFGLDGTEGALVSDVSDDSPAQKAGLKAGDVILSADGADIDDSTTLPRLIGQVAPGDEVSLQVMRGGDQRKVDVTVGDWPDQTAADGSPSSASSNDQTKLGIAISDLSDQEKQQLDIDNGALVRRVDPRGAAAAAGIQPGDVVVSFDQKAIDSADQLIDAVKQADGDRAIPVRIVRDGTSLFVALRLKVGD